MFRQVFGFRIGLSFWLVSSPLSAVVGFVLRTLRIVPSERTPPGGVGSLAGNLRCSFIVGGGGSEGGGFVCFLSVVFHWPISLPGGLEVVSAVGVGRCRAA